MVRFYAIALLLIAAPLARATAPVDFDRAMRSEINALPAPDAGGGGGQVGAAAGSPTPRNAFFLSALLPGLGQLYAGGWSLRSYTALRAAGYMAFEGFGWYEYADYKQQGWDKQDEYREYADEHWHWKEDPCAYSTEYRNALPEPPDLSTEALRLEFYEDIHKLPKWICGWDDYPDEVFFRTDENVVIEETPMRVYYRGLRREQNDLLTTSRHWLLAILANHGVSAFDAYFTARKARRAGMEEGLSIDFGKPATGVGGTIGLAWKF